MTDSDKTESFERLAALQLDDFAPHVGTEFSLLSDDGNRIPVELVATRDLDIPSLPESARRPFALIFRGPADPQLAQRIYELEHAEMSKLALFLVPVGADELGQHYEAIFN